MATNATKGWHCEAPQLGGARPQRSRHQERVLLLEGLQPLPVQTNATRVPAAEESGGGRRQRPPGEPPLDLRRVVLQQDSRSRNATQVVVVAAVVVCSSYRLHASCNAPVNGQQGRAEASCRLPPAHLSAARKATTGWSFFRLASPYTMTSLFHHTSADHFRSYSALE